MALATIPSLALSASVGRADGSAEGTWRDWIRSWTSPVAHSESDEHRSGRDCDDGHGGSREGEDDGHGSTKKCTTDRFVQESATKTHSIDLLFVTDTSGSLNEERGKIAQGIDSFVARLPSQVDYRIGVMLGHSSKSSYAGSLYRYRRNPYVLDSQSLNRAQLRQALSENLINGPSDYFADGGEELFYSFTQAFSGSRFAQSQRLGFFRPSAALVVVFVSDEQEICYDYKTGEVPVPDYDYLEGPAKVRDCGGGKYKISHASIQKLVKSYAGDRPVAFGAIVYTDPKTVPPVGENEYGHGYMDLIQESGGIAIDIGAADYRAGLTQLGDHVANKLNLKTDFKLSQSGFDLTTLRVFVDGKSVTYTYSPTLNQVHIDAAGGSGSIIEVEYCQGGISPSPTPSVTPSPTPSVTPSPTPSVTPSPTPSVTPSPTPTPTGGTGGNGGDGNIGV